MLDRRRSAHIIYFFLFKPNKFGSAVLPLTACIVLVNAGVRPRYPARTRAFP